ncbi:MAG: hypothetical protein AAF203_04370, partial [Pseudomonadota bacterium]
MTLTKTGRALILLIFLSSLGACVSNSTHESLQKNHDRLKKDLEQQTSKVDELETLVAELERKLGKEASNKKSMANSISHMKTALKDAADRK